MIYAGSLVNPALLELCKADCARYNSAEMTLEQMLDIMGQAERAGKATVRLHTGDPCLYGAVREQMDALDRLGIPYDITPGVSSFCGAAAVLECQHIRADIEIVEDAHSYGLSFGKYYAYLQLSQYDSGVTPEDCKHMDISTIHELTCEHEQNETTDGENAPSKETRCHHHDKKHNQSHKQ